MQGQAPSLPPPNGAVDKTLCWLTNIDLQHGIRMAMTPIPIVAAAPLVSSFPVDVILMALLPIHTVCARLSIIPFVIVLVLLVVIAVLIASVVAVVRSLRLRI
jgi:hypothetical protein